MKIAGTFMIALVGGVAVNGMSIRGNTKHANKLMAASRRLSGSGDEGGSGDNGSGDNGSGDNESGDNEESGSADSYDEVMFLTDYSITLLSCISGAAVRNNENGESEGSSVVFRLCPSSSCDTSTSAFGCDDGYGDYVVGINTFLEAYREGQREEEHNSGDEENGQQYNNPMVKYNQWGQEFDASEYMECSEYKQEEGNQGENQNNWNNNNDYYRNNNYYGDMQFWIGPGCTADGTSIALNTYVNEECTYPFQGNFSDIARGWSNLPFSDGGLVSMECVACSSADDEGNVEVSELCQQDFESAVARCEETMVSDGDYYHYTYTGGCSYIDSLLTEIYNNRTDGTTDDGEDRFKGVKDTVKKASSNIYDTLNTQEARAFIAVMVVFGLAVFAGMSFIACICVKKRRKRRIRKQQSKLLPPGSDDEESVTKRRSSVVSLVRASTNNIKESVAAAFNGGDDKTVTEDDAVEPSSSYMAPELEEEEEAEKVEEPDEELVADEPEEEPEEEPSTPEESVTASDATQKTRGSRFLSKMDKHLKKKLSTKKK